MHLKWIFWLLAFILFAAAKQPETPGEACSKEIQQIDQQILKLEQQKQYHQERARYYQKQGDSWQYNTGNIQDGYLAWGRANDERRKAIDIQHQIDLLNQRKQLIMQFYPELWQP